MGSDWWSLSSLVLNVCEAIGWCASYDIALLTIRNSYTSASKRALWNIGGRRVMVKLFLESQQRFTWTLCGPRHAPHRSCTSRKSNQVTNLDFTSFARCWRRTFMSSLVVKCDMSAERDMSQKERFEKKRALISS
jgi:hypothetical protein